MNAPADLILFNGRITTLDRQYPQAKAVAIRAGAAVGDEAAGSFGGCHGRSQHAMNRTVELAVQGAAAPARATSMDILMTGSGCQRLRRMIFELSGARSVAHAGRSNPGGAA
jgi:hypothetical protein